MYQSVSYLASRGTPNLTLIKTFVLRMERSLLLYLPAEKMGIGKWAELVVSAADEY